jgi:hypothetical protein
MPGLWLKEGTKGTFRLKGRRIYAIISLAIRQKLKGKAKRTSLTNEECPVKRGPGGLFPEKS